MSTPCNKINLHSPAGPWTLCHSLKHWGGSEQVGPHPWYRGTIGIVSIASACKRQTPTKIDCFSTFPSFHSGQLYLWHLQVCYEIAPETSTNSTAPIVKLIDCMQQIHFVKSSINKRYASTMESSQSLQTKYAKSCGLMAGLRIWNAYHLRGHWCGSQPPAPVAGTKTTVERSRVERHDFHRSRLIEKDSLIASVDSIGEFVHLSSLHCHFIFKKFQEYNAVHIWWTWS